MTWYESIIFVLVEQVTDVFKHLDGVMGVVFTLAQVGLNDGLGSLGDHVLNLDFLLEVLTFLLHLLVERRGDRIHDNFSLEARRTSFLQGILQVLVTVVPAAHRTLQVTDVVGWVGLASDFLLSFLSLFALFRNLG